MLCRLLVTLLVLFAAGAYAAPSSNDPDLTITSVVSGVAQPTAMAFVGDGDFLILEMATGKVRRVTGDVLNPTAVLDLDVEGCSERGLLGIALHPDFATNHFVYLYYNPAISAGGDTALCEYFAGYVNRVDRFVWDSSAQGGAGSLTLETANILSVHSDVPYHNGGSIAFGPDDKLYGVIGDGGHNDNFNNGKLQNNASGEPDDTGIVFRLNDDGTSPNDNPFAAITGMEKVFAYGIRNSFGITFDPVNGSLWESENGEDDYDEVNRIPAGMNGGWADIMGPTSRFPTGDDNLFVAADSAYSDPEFSWKDVVAPTGIAFGGSALGAYQNDLFVGDFNFGLLYHFTLNGGRTGLSLSGNLSDLVADNNTERNSVVAAQGFGSTDLGISDLETGPDGALYVVSLSGTVHKVTGEGSGGPPPHDLAVSKVKAPKKISLSETKPEVVKALKVTIVNQGSDTETINDLVELEDLVEIEWTSLAPAACLPPATDLVPPKKGFPVVLATKKKLNLSYDVTWECANDPAQSSKDAPHADFEVEVEVEHGALGGGDDSDPSDDVCPRPASGDDKGCGGKDANGAIGGPIRTDVVVK